MDILLTLMVRSKSDVITHRKVDGFVHCLAINEEGMQLAVAYGSQVAVFDEPFRTSKINYVALNDICSLVPLEQVINQAT